MTPHVLGIRYPEMRLFLFFSLAREMCSGGRIFRCLLLEENTGTGIYGRLPGILPVVRSMALG